MRIAMVSQSYYPQLGGVSEHVYHLSEALRAMGHGVTVITSGPAVEASPDVIRIGRNTVFPMNGAMVNVTVGLRLGARLRRIYERGAFDLIHIHSPLEPTLPLAALRAARHLAVPVVGTFHMSAKRSPAYEVFAGLLGRDAARLDVRIAVSESARVFALRYFPADYTVIPNGVCFERFSAAPRRARGRGRSPQLLFVGRFDVRKNVPWLTRAFRLLLRSRPDCRLVLVGSGITKPVCRIMTLGLGRAVIFRGRVPPDEIADCYASADVFCSLPGGSESFGIVLLEAMAAGLPIVGTDIPGYREVVEHGVNGLLVRPGDTPALVSAFSSLIGDEPMRESMGRSGRRKAREFDWSKIARTVQGAYAAAVPVP
jgi:phosphatidylinositol alpha-mannosyltransferase